MVYKLKRKKSIIYSKGKYHTIKFNKQPCEHILHNIKDHDCALQFASQGDPFHKEGIAYCQYCCWESDYTLKEIKPKVK